MRILLLGGTGNISAECAECLHRAGHEIVVVSRGRTPVPPAYRAVRADRGNPEALQAALRGIEPEIVINFIGYDLPEVQADYQVFRGSLRQYVFVSSTVVYAKPPPALPVTEATPVGNPHWDYAVKKLRCEQWLQGRWEEERFPVTIVRPSHTYSPRWIPNAISSASHSFAARLDEGRPVFVHGDGESRWTLTAASDFAAGLSGLLGKPEALGEAVHITSDEVLTWNRIYAEIADALGARSPEIMRVPTEFICRVAPELSGTLRGDKAHPGVFDNSKIRRLVPGFRCEVPFHAGIRNSVEWLRSHPEKRILNPEVDRICDLVIGSWRNRT